MKRTIAALALTAGLALSCSPALADEPVGETCTTTQETVSVIITPYVPAVEPVYETVTEYEFAHKKADHPQSPRWEREGWNAEPNPNSVGWEWTGATREVQTDTVLVPGSPEQPAVYGEQVIDVTTCAPVLHEPVVPVEEEPVATCEEGGLVTAEDGSCVPASFYEEPVIEEPAATVPDRIEEDEPGWDCATMGNKVCGPVPADVTAVRTADSVPLASVGGHGAELAYTGAADWVLPAGLGLLAAGGALVALRRKVA